MPANLSGARVLLTGASGGIGNAIARALHERDSHVIVTGRRGDQLEALRDELGERIEPVVADLAKASDVTMLAERAAGVDVFVSNAGLPGSGAIDSFDPNEIDRAIDVNLRAPMQLTRAFVPPMRERGAGQVVLVSSMNGKVSAGFASVYAATKFGLRGFGLGLNDELHGTGVGVTVVNPGFIRDAGMFADADVKLPPGVGTKTPEQVADAVVAGIEKGRGDIDVAPLTVKFAGRAYGVAPGVMASVQRRLGAHKVASDLSAAQAGKR